MLNDYSGPYGAAGPALDIGQRAFWLWANSTGGMEITVWQSEKDLMRHTIHKNI